MFETIDGIRVWGTPLMDAVNQMKNIAKDAAFTALMGDHHVGYSMPIGGVAAYTDQISPSGVGFDIGCGNTALRLDVKYDDIFDKVPAIMDELFQTISFGIGRVNDERVDHELFEDETWKLIPFLSGFKKMAQSQLGTVGSGNHYVDLFRDESDFIWIGTHFGSRGIGHKTATHYLNLIGAKDGMFVDAALIDVNTDLGREYIMAMKLAGEYAHAGRTWVANRVAKIIGGKVTKVVNNHHNFAWEEEHFGEKYWVVRKGATPLFPGQESFVGSTMADVSYILEGIDSAESSLALNSTVHGAGRVMSRTAAAGKKKYSKGRAIHAGGGLISHEMMMERVNAAGVELRGAGVDESPHCYKKLDEVLISHFDTLDIKHKLWPIGVAMAGSDIYDEYKD